MGVGCPASGWRGDRTSPYSGDVALRGDERVYLGGESVTYSVWTITVKRKKENKFWV